MTTTSSITSSTSSGTITSLGVGSGLDLSGLLDDLESAEEESRLTPITDQEDAVESKISAYGTLQSALTSLQTAIATLSDSSTYDTMSSSVTGTGVSAAVTSNAIAGTYSIAVTQLAQAQTLVTSGVSDTTSSLGTGELTIELASGSSTSIDITSDNNSLEGIRDAINDADTGVTASIINDGSTYRLILSSDTTGEDSEMSVTFTGSGDAASLLNYNSTTQSMSETVAAQNAELTVNGLSITSQSNTVEEAIQGTTLSLTATGSQTLTIDQDTDSIISAINDFVDAYNSYISTTDDLTSYDADTGDAGELLGDSTERRIETLLSQDIYNQVDNGGAYSYLSSLGITLQTDGTLEIDDDTLSDAVTNNLSAVTDFFVGSSDSSEDGFASRMASSLDSILDEDTGLIVSRTDGLESQLEDLQDRYDAQQSLIDSLMARYQDQFTQLDTLLSELDSTSTYLTEQFDALSSSSSS